jgi:hypothetical protein
MIIGVAFCGCQAAKVTIYSEDEITPISSAAKVRVFPTRKNFFFLNRVEKMVVDSNFLLGIGFCKTVDLHTIYKTNRHSVLYSVE